MAGPLRVARQKERPDWRLCRGLWCRTWRVRFGMVVELVAVLGAGAVAKARDVTCVVDGGILQMVCDGVVYQT